MRLSPSGQQEPKTDSSNEQTDQEGAEYERDAKECVEIAMKPKAAVDEEPAGDQCSDTPNDPNRPLTTRY